MEILYIKGGVIEALWVPYSGPGKGSQKGSKKGSQTVDPEMTTFGTNPETTENTENHLFHFLSVLNILERIVNSRIMTILLGGVLPGGGQDLDPRMSKKGQNTNKRNTLGVRDFLGFSRKLRF